MQTALEQERTRSRFELTGTALKWIAVVTMFIDHCAASLLEPRLSSYRLLMIDEVLRGIGRIAFPLFLFLMVEGFFYTRSRSRYLGRLAVFALLSEIPFDLAFNLTREEVMQGKLFELGGQNVFFTLFLGLLSITLVERLRPDRQEEGEGLFLSLLRALACAGVICLSCALAQWMQTDYHWAGVLALVAGYLVWPIKKPEAELCAIALPLLILTGREVPGLLALVPVVFYRGSRGRQGNKWFFYFFYPGHLLLLGLINVFLLG